MNCITTRPRRKRSEEGVALIVAIATVAILSVMLTDMHETTGTAFAVSTSQRDALQAEYMAKSAINLTRLLIAKEPQVRRFVDPLYRAATGRPTCPRPGSGSRPRDPRAPPGCWASARTRFGSHSRSTSISPRAPRFCCASSPSGTSYCAAGLPLTRVVYPRTESGLPRARRCA